MKKSSGKTLKLRMIITLMAVLLPIGSVGIYSVYKVKVVSQKSEALNKEHNSTILFQRSEELSDAISYFKTE